MNRSDALPQSGHRSAIGAVVAIGRTKVAVAVPPPAPPLGDTLTPSARVAPPLVPKPAAVLVLEPPAVAAPPATLAAPPAGAVLPADAMLASCAACAPCASRP